MSANDLPMMPFFVKDWLAATMHWTDAERGAYVSLLFFQWVNGFVPSEVTQLARIMGTTEERFEGVWSIVGPKFDADERGLFNIRLEEHRKESLRLRASRALGATLANEKRRAGRDARRAAQRIAERSAEHVAEHNAERHAERTHTSTSTSTSSSSDLSPNGEISSEGARSSDSSDSGGGVRGGTKAAGALGNPHQRYSAHREEKLDDRFIEFKVTYPGRIGPQHWPRARENWHDRTAEGYTPEQIIEATERYSQWCTANGKSCTVDVMPARDFLGRAKPFLADWEAPPAANDGEWRSQGDEPAGEVA